MANFSNVTITRPGRSHFSHALTKSLPISFDHMEIGDGTAPLTPEDLTELVHTLTSVGIAKITEEPDGSIAVRGNFSAVGIAGNFYLREIGLYVKSFEAGGDPVLFAYANAGEQADFVPDTSGSSLMEEMIIVSLVMGGAKIMFSDIDPTARATVGDLKELKDEIDIESLRAEIKEATDSLGEAKEGFVLKSGDKMTGTLEAKEFIGPLTGSASLWCGWKNYTGLDDLNKVVGSELLEATATIETIISKMELNSRLIHAFGYQTYCSNPAFPMGQGILEIRKMKDNVADVLFTANNGLAWAGIYWGDWKGWNSRSGKDPGTLTYFTGEKPPLGALWPNGQAVSRTTYPRLFAVDGVRYGAGDGHSTFNVIDVRGRFLRCLDQGKGLDPNRTLGSIQNDGAPNITGTGGCYENPQAYRGKEWQVAGAFYIEENPTYLGIKGSDNDNARINFDASRSNGKYGSANEIRPTNIAVNAILYY